MRVATRYEYTHFGVTFKTNKPEHLSLESFIERDSTRKTSDGFFWHMRYMEQYKLYPKEIVVEYFNSLKNELWSMKVSGTTQMVRYWCDRALNYFSGDYIKDQRKYRRQYYRKHKYKEKMTFDEFVNNEIMRIWNRERADYDFSDSVLRPYYSDFFYEDMQKYLIENYNANMDHFNKLSESEFNDTLNRFLKYEGHFQKIETLDDTKYEKPGYYILVLDEYKQVYIGVSSNIKNRIIEHFKKSKPVDRRICGYPKTSKISIDSFGAKDISRIYVQIDKLLNMSYNAEDYYIECFDNKFVTNRVMGGELPIGLDGVEQKEMTE